MANEGPFKAHLDAADEKMRREQEEEVQVTLKGKHLGLIRRALWSMICDKGAYEVLAREVDQIIYEAAQRI